MKTLAFLQSKLNGYSVIGSVIYGSICLLFSTPEVLAVIGYALYFLSAALFYFMMYILYSENRGLVSRLWKHKVKNVCIVMLGIAIGVWIADIAYMLFNNVPFEVAGEAIAIYMGNFFYYIPFLP